MWVRKGDVLTRMLSLIDRYFIKKPRVRQFVTKMFAGDSDKRVTLVGEDYLVNTLFEHGYFRASKLAQDCSLFRDELPVLVHLAGVIRDGDTFLDIGANIGFFAVQIANLRALYPNLKTYAFEPNSNTVDRLRANVESFGVTVFAVALSDRNGTLNFVEGAVSNVFATVDNASSYSITAQQKACECRRLEDMPIQGDSIVMKVDVEGHEWEVLQGSVSLFKDKRIRAIYLDGFKDARVLPFLESYEFRLLDGRTLAPATLQTRNLLAIKAKLP
jgi:FkbM family methyltransferase